MMTTIRNEDENGPMKAWGWTVLKRRRIQKKIKDIHEDEKGKDNLICACKLLTCTDKTKNKVTRCN